MNQAGLSLESGELVPVNSLYGAERRTLKNALYGKQTNKWIKIIVPPKYTESPMCSWMYIYTLSLFIYVST